MTPGELGGSGSQITFDVFFMATEVEVLGEPVELITSGSFETGDFTGWTVQDPVDPFAPWSVGGANEGNWFGNTQPQDGAFVAWNGFDGCGPGEFVMFQDVEIPAGAAAELSSMDRLQWDTFGSIDRTYEVQARHPITDEVLAVLFDFVAPAGTTDDTQWQAHTADLSHLAGNAVSIYFVEDIPECFSGPAQFEVDAVSLIAQAPGGCSPKHQRGRWRADLPADEVARAARGYVISVRGATG